MEPTIFISASKDDSFRMESFKDFLSVSKKFVNDQKTGSMSESFSEQPEKGTSYSTPVSNGNSHEPLLHISKIHNFQPPNKFQVLQRWEGHILEISDEECRALVHNLSSPNIPDEEVTFSTQEISPPDRLLALPGAVFYWAIGYEDSAQGQRTRQSKIRVQRLPVWTKKEIDSAKREAEQLKEQLGW